MPRELKNEIWPCYVSLGPTEVNSITTWLETCIGSRYEEWVTVVTGNSTYYYFKKEQDQMFFMIQWTK